MNLNLATPQVARLLSVGRTREDYAGEALSIGIQILLIPLVQLCLASFFTLRPRCRAR
jgi:hypothetical protein